VEKYYGIIVQNNPVNFIDPDGLCSLFDPGFGFGTYMCGGGGGIGGGGGAGSRSGGGGPKISIPSEQGFIVKGRLRQIWDDPKWFINWLRGNQSLTRVGKPLSECEARQLIENADRLRIPVDLNPTGLQGLEQTGQWAGIPHFKIGNVHIPIIKGILE
jgi:hypothetical protein